ncbi:MAG: hypothetical protein FJ138_04150, partial [Deltaproteobacteria bacterium]|nr:hypothetical protein [Deltaproteobacteria bacterium]
MFSFFISLLSNSIGLITLAFFVLSLIMSLRDLRYKNITPDEVINKSKLREFDLVALSGDLTYPRLTNINAGITICTLLGLLGTFIGMSKGLADINTSDEKLLEGAKNLIGNMSYAFETSLWGVSASALLTVVQSAVHYSVKNHFQKIYAAIHKDPKQTQRLITPIEMLARIERAQSPEVAREMSAVVLQMSASVDLLADAARGFNLDRLGAEIGRSLEQSVINHMSPPLERLASEVRDLRQSHENQREEMLRSVIDELNTRVFLPITGQIRDLATQLARSDETTQTLVSAVKITSDDLTRLSASIHDSLESMRETQQATYAELQKYANFLSDTLTKSNEILAKQHRAFEISAQRSAEMLEKVREDTHKMFEGFTHTLAREAAEILRQARIEVEQSLHVVPAMLTSVREETTMQLTQFRETYQA